LSSLMMQGMMRQRRRSACSPSCRKAIWLRCDNLFEINSKGEEVAKKEELYNSVDSEEDSEDSKDYYNYRRNPFW
jgi:hypothetical protein